MTGIYDLVEILKQGYMPTSNGITWIDQGGLEGNKVNVYLHSGLVRKIGRITFDKENELIVLTIPGTPDKEPESEVMLFCLDPKPPYKKPS